MNQAAQIVRLPSAKPQAPAAKHRLGKRAARAIRRQLIIAGTIGVVAVAITALSLHHLATGVELVTHSTTWEAWSMAIGIDIGFIATELSQLVIGEKLRKRLAIYLKTTVFGTLAASAAMNVGAFAAHADGWMLYPAVLFGLAIPALIYLFTRIGAGLYIDCHSRGV
jgi:hypothetical protein